MLDGETPQDTLPDQADLDVSRQPIHVHRRGVEEIQ
jgi:hypothetical protein